MSNENHDYAEIYTPSQEEPAVWAPPQVAAPLPIAAPCKPPSQERMSASSSAATRTGSGDSGLSGPSQAATPAAPPPPLHKYPSWEDRIYQVGQWTWRIVPVEYI
jgi:hypothetical protein